MHASPLTMEAFVLIQMRLIFDDPLHRYYTFITVGHEPTNEDLTRHWYESGAAVRFSHAAQHAPFIWPPTAP